MEKICPTFLSTLFYLIGPPNIRTQPPSMIGFPKIVFQRLFPTTPQLSSPKGTSASSCTVAGILELFFNTRLVPFIHVFFPLLFYFPFPKYSLVTDFFRRPGLIPPFFVFVRFVSFFREPPGRGRLLPFAWPPTRFFHLFRQFESPPPILFVPNGIELSRGITCSFPPGFPQRVLFF